MQTLSLTGANGVSDILIETGLLARAGAAILDTFSPSRVHIVTDSTVAPLYLDKLEGQLPLPGFAYGHPRGRRAQAADNGRNHLP